VIAIESGRSIGVDWPPGLAVSEALPAPRFVEPALECNMGGPMSRCRSLTLQSTILGDGVDHVSCPCVRSVALDFGEADPLPYVWGLLAGLGYSSPEAARGSLLPILQRCVCCVSNEIAPDRVASLEPEVVLEQALVLGLSTKSLFDPTRPVIWTRASLTRRLNLYEVEGFYA
jgi:hypothetical protein